MILNLENWLYFGLQFGKNCVYMAVSGAPVFTPYSPQSLSSFLWSPSIYFICRWYHFACLLSSWATMARRLHSAHQRPCCSCYDRAALLFCAFVTRGRRTDCFLLGVVAHRRSAQALQAFGFNRRDWLSSCSVAWSWMWSLCSLRTWPVFSRNWRSREASNRHSKSSVPVSCRNCSDLHYCRCVSPVR